MLKELQLAEIGSLRGEVNSVIDRMNGNENFSAGTVSAIFAFILSTETTLISLVLALLSLVIVFIGIRRYSELRAHARKLDEYLKATELDLSDSGGWTVHYYRSIEGSSSGGYSETRYVFWIAMGVICALGTVYVGYSVISESEVIASKDPATDD
ncbi:hypothetical protein RA28_10790 [Ruegeria sp. ANG-S4]|uniref:hypothetical protein n=1 Tax=Ruegeria sp. ANG-S4 TaxID=1577904 RepID=UPI00057FA520|nr:hypothetical protein [Ruegeria sp. ANG-S4]KIC44985.1 hypothetical protein RA28_10790 [Ruegeria sp. ANG-S4]